MAMKYLFDTNIVIYYLGGFALSSNALERIDDICKKAQHISVIFKLELLGFNFASASNEKETKEFVARSLVYSINPKIETETIRIRKSVKIKLADAIIAATSIINNFSLLTRNVNDFNSIDN